MARAKNVETMDNEQEQETEFETQEGTETYLKGFRGKISTPTKVLLDNLVDRSGQDVGLIIESALNAFFSLPTEQQKSFLVSTMANRVVL